MWGVKEICALLKEREIPFFLEEHPAVYTIEEMEQLGIEREGGTVAKNLFLRDNKGKRHFLVVMEKSKQADLKALRELLGSTALSFASEERLMRFLGLSKGSVTPFGVLHDEAHQVEVILDNDLQNACWIGVHPNINTATLWIAPGDLERILRECGNPVRFVNL